MIENIENNNFEGIPQSLFKDYIFSKEKIKYGSFGDANYEKEKIQPSNPNIMIEKVKLLQNSISSILEQISFFIRINKNGFNELCLLNNKKSLDYHILFKLVLDLIEQILIKIEEKEDEIEIINFSDLIIFIQNEYPRVYDKQYLNAIEVKIKAEKIINFIHIIKNCVNKPGMILTHIAEYSLTTYIKKLEDQIQKFNSIGKFKDNNFLNNKTKKNEIVFYDLVYLFDKIYDLALCLNNGYILDINDICNIPEDDREWKKMNNKIFRIIPKNNEEIEKDIEEQDRSNPFFMSLLFKVIHKPSAVSKVTSAIGNGIKYKLSEEKTEHDCKKGKLNLSEEIIFKFFRLWRNKFLKSILVKTFDNIKFRKKLYLKREQREINLEYIQKLNDFLNGKIPSNQSTSNGILNDDIEIKEKPIYLEQIEKSEKKYYVSTRLLHTSKIYFKGEKIEKKKFIPFSKPSIILPKENQIRETILIHIHGGAFIGSSTFTHENYLRKWCNKLNIPIIGIDYGLSPENKYPTALNDVFQGYNWIINHAKKEFNLNFKNIILSGDSAGGNIAIALLYLIITINLYEGTKIQIPNLVFLEYPTTYLGKDNITNSLLFSLNEDLITSNFLQFARDSYGGDYLNFNDPFFSVIKANEKIIKHLPKIRFLFGGKDPLRDDSIRTIYDICQFDNCNIDVKGYELIHFGHGFNASDTEILRKYASDFVYAEIEELIKEREGSHNDNNDILFN